jgi:hypothetical protein
MGGVVLGLGCVRPRAFACPLLSERSEASGEEYLRTNLLCCEYGPCASKPIRRGEGAGGGGEEAVLIILMYLCQAFGLLVVRTKDSVALSNICILQTSVLP